MTLQHFGTDGIRGPVGGDRINEAFARRFGGALGAFLEKHIPNKPHFVVIARDTRESGGPLLRAIVEGLYHYGVNVYRLEVAPTPAVSRTVRELQADLGVVITASHNPASDNGYKLFNNRGMKFELAAEAEIERFFEAQKPLPALSYEILGAENDGTGYYINALRSRLDQGVLRDWKLVLDTANGATSEAAPAVFRHLGAELTLLGNRPDGLNINQGCGSEVPEAMGRAVVETGARLGLAFDGDGDRVVFADETGSVLQGDEVLGILALDYLRQDKLSGKRVVATIQSNAGLDQTLREAGAQLDRVEVGDRNVVVRMLNLGANLGGEASGHFVLMDEASTGDGLLTAICICEIVLRTGRPLSQLRREVTLFPQKTRNLRVAEKKPLDTLEELQAAVARVRASLDGAGRVLVRYSGTEPKLRFLVEGPEEATLETALDTLEAAARASLDCLPTGGH
ncbi:MAG: phosphoglucosamine mutase [Opitutales bacterium]